MTIVTKSGEFGYNPLPTVMCASGDILKGKADKLIGDIKGGGFLLLMVY